MNSKARKNVPTVLKLTFESEVSGKLTLGKSRSEANKGGRQRKWELVARETEEKGIYRDTRMPAYSRRIIFWRNEGHGLRSTLRLDDKLVLIY